MTRNYLKKKKNNKNKYILIHLNYYELIDKSFLSFFFVKTKTLKQIIYVVMLKIKLFLLIYLKKNYFFEIEYIKNY